MAESLYTTQTPDSGLDDLNDLGIVGVGGTTATTMIFASNGTVSHIRFFSTVTISGTYTAELWQVTDDTTGTRLASKSVAAAGITSAGWNTIAFDAAVSVTAGVAYRAALHNNAGRYVARANVFTADLVTGNITGPQDGSSPNPPNVGALNNGNFKTDSAANAYPGGPSGPTSYLIDVLYTAGSGDTAVTGAATLGRVVAAATAVRTVVVTGTKALGALAAAATMSPSRTIIGAATLGRVAAAGQVEREAGAGPRGGGWQSLLDIVRYARETRDQEVIAPVTECPNDGWALLTAPDGGVYCPFDGWRPR